MADKKTKIEGYLIDSGKIKFTNHLNKVISTIEIREVLERWREEIEEMSVSII